MNEYEIMKKNIRGMIDPDEEQFYTDDVLEEIIAMIIMSPEVYSDTETDVLFDYWAEYPWDLDRILKEELGDSDEENHNRVMKLVEAKIRVVRRNKNDYNIRSIIREVIGK